MHLLEPVAAHVAQLDRFVSVTLAYLVDLYVILFDFVDRHCQIINLLEQFLVRNDGRDQERKSMKD